MTQSNPNQITTQEKPTTSSIWQLIHTQLAKKKRQIAQEILHYPPPIPACDAQFNFLLEERARVTTVLAQLEEWAAQPWDKNLLEKFLATSPDLDEAIVKEIRGIMRKA